MRRQPVAFALIDAAFLADTKWRALRRRLPEPGDFNSAVGAWLIVLTAARRNGLPDVDIEEEAEDPSFIADLVAVGLLTQTGIPAKPWKEWAPARPKRPSESNVSNVSDESSVSKVSSASETSSTIGGAVSPPLPSTPLRSVEGRVDHVVESVDGVARDDRPAGHRTKVRGFVGPLGR
jgi:hypothetical protein